MTMARRRRMSMEPAAGRDTRIHRAANGPDEAASRYVFDMMRLRQSEWTSLAPPA
jgi:hypothetical protein